MNRSESFSDGLGEHRKREMVTTQYGSARVGRNGYVSNVVVDHENRGAGHGHELMERVTEYADKAGLPLTMHARAALHGFYAHHGFEVTDPDSKFGPELKRPPRGSK